MTDDVGEISKAYDDRPWEKWYNEYDITGAVDFNKYDNLCDLITRHAKEFSDLPAFTTCLDNGLTGTLTYEQVDTLSDQFAAYLRHDLNLNDGDRVAVQVPNCLSFPIAAFGILKAGCTLVNVNPLYTAPEMVHQLNDSGTKVLIIIDLFADKLPEVMKNTKVEHVLTVNVADYFPFLTGLLVKTVLKLKKLIPAITVPAKSFKTAVSNGQKHFSAFNANRPNPALTDAAVLQYTGGTTGVSKGARLNHSNILANIIQIDASAGSCLTPRNNTVLTALPLYHIFAFSVNMFFSYTIGSHNILIPSPRPINKLRKAFEKFDINLFSGLNILFSALLDEDWFKSNPPKNFKVVLAGGAALHKSVAEKWQSVVGMEIREGFGLTESSPVLCVNPVNGKVKLGSVGLAMPNTDIRIVNDSGELVPLGESGEIIAKGPQIMAGYWERPEETANTVKDGWLYTGDIGKIDDDGYLFIVDRKKDMIIVSGFNVFPNEIEDVISKHPDVIEVAVIGIPDERTGECVKAYINSRNSSLCLDDIRSHCDGQLTKYKLPKQVELCDDLPKSTVGKILRRELRKRDVPE